MSEQPLRETVHVGQLESFLVAVQFLTRIPVKSNAVPDSMERYQSVLPHAVIYFPLVGMLIGLSTALIMLGLDIWLPTSQAVLLALVFEAMLTGAFHEDALADTCDAFGGGWTREQILEILKDSRIGTYGALGLGLGVALRAFCMMEIGRDPWWYVLLIVTLAAGLGRVMILYMMVQLEPVTDHHSLARDVYGQGKLRALLLGSMCVLPLMLIWTGLEPRCAGLALLLLFMFAVYYLWRVRVRLGGSTGDILGCSAFIAQLLVLLTANAWK